MSKSTLSIIVPGPGPIPTRTIEVPCRLLEAFNFKFAGKTYTATIAGDGWAASISEVENDDGFAPAEEATLELAESILATIKAALGITGPVPPGSPLPAIALAYEAEVAAHDAHVRALQAMPIKSLSTGLIPPHPDDTVAGGIASPAARMLAKYVEHVVQNAAAQVAP